MLTHLEKWAVVGSFRGTPEVWKLRFGYKRNLDEILRSTKYHKQNDRCVLIRVLRVSVVVMRKWPLPLDRNFFVLI